MTLPSFLPCLAGQRYGNEAPCGKDGQAVDQEARVMILTTYTSLHSSSGLNSSSFLRSYEASYRPTFPFLQLISFTDVRLLSFSMLRFS